MAGKWWIVTKKQLDIYIKNNIIIIFIGQRFWCPLATLGGSGMQRFLCSLVLFSFMVIFGNLAVAQAPERNPNDFIAIDDGPLNIFLQKKDSQKRHSSFGTGKGVWLFSRIEVYNTSREGI